MNNIKRFLAITLLLATLITLTGCIIIPRYKNYDDIDTENVASVEIYDLRETERIDGSYFLESEEPVYELAEEQQESFWADLADIRFTDHILIVLAAVDPSFHYDEWVVRINYNDGSFDLISCDGYGESFDSEGNITDSNHYSCDDEEWHALIEKYVPEEIFEAVPETSEGSEQETA